MKKIISLAICLIILSSMCLSAFAQDSQPSQTEESKQVILKETFTVVKGSRKTETVKKDFISVKMSCWSSYFYLDFRTEPLQVFANEGSGAVIDRIDLEVDSLGSYANNLVVKAVDSSALNYHYSATISTRQSVSNKCYFHITDINNSNIKIGGDNHSFCGYSMDVYYRIDASKLTDKQLSDALAKAQNEYDAVRYNLLAKEVESRNAGNFTLASVLSEGNIALICVGEAIIFAIIIVIIAKRTKRNNNSVLENADQKE